MKFRGLAPAIAAILLAACAGMHNAVPPIAQTTHGDQAASEHKLTVSIRIVIPRRKHRRHDLRGRYLSPSTKGMSIAFSGPTTADKTLALTPASSNCSASASGTVCTETVALAPCPSKGACYTGSIATYDEVVCTGSACVIPLSAHALSANQTVRFSVARGRKNSIPLTLDGIPASVTLVPLASSTLSGSSATGFTISKCVTAPQSVDVVAVDADGNDIVGPGAPASSLVSSDPVHLTVVAASSGSNGFTLVPPASLQSATIPNAGAVVDLTAGATPLSSSGGLPVSTQIGVTFNGDVCGVMTEYTIPSAYSLPYEIAAGSDGALWFTEESGNRIGRITTSGTITETAVPTTRAHLYGIAAGPDGALWFTEQGGNKIGRITTGGTITETAVPTNPSLPSDIAAGSDGALWFTECSANKIGRITTGGTITETAIPTSASEPLGITSGPDGALWFTEEAGDKIGRITTGATITETAIPTSHSVSWVIAAGPDGALWFTECQGNKVGRITTGGTITETAIPTLSSQPYGIAAGPDGAMWFAESGANKIGRITTSGTITETTLPTSGSEPHGVAAGPDGAIWFTELNANKIGRIQ